MRYAIRCQILQSGPIKAGVDEPAVIQSQDAEVSAAVETRAQRVEQDKPLSKLKVVDSPFSNCPLSRFYRNNRKISRWKYVFSRLRNLTKGKVRRVYTSWKGAYCIDCMSEKERRCLS